MTHSTDHETAELTGLIRRVQPSESDLVAEHLLRLDHGLRSRRFSHDVSDEFIRRYAATVAAPGNLAYAYFENGHIHALGELRHKSFAWGIPAEAAFTVEKDYAHRGLATRLMERIMRAARNRGVRHLFLYYLADNAGMKAISRHFGAELTFEGGTVIADIAPPRPTLGSVSAEAIDNRISRIQSLIDYQLSLFDMITDKEVKSADQKSL